MPLTTTGIILVIVYCTALVSLPIPILIMRKRRMVVRNGNEIGMKHSEFKRLSWDDTIEYIKTHIINDEYNSLVTKAISQNEFMQEGIDLNGNFKCVIYSCDSLSEYSIVCYNNHTTCCDCDIMMEITLLVNRYNRNTSRFSNNTIVRPILRQYWVEQIRENNRLKCSICRSSYKTINDKKIRINTTEIN